MHPGYIKPRIRCEDSAQEYDTEQKKIILGKCEFKSFCYALHFRYGGKKVHVFIVVPLHKLLSFLFSPLILGVQLSSPKVKLSLGLDWNNSF